jgi:hypothetical protein
LTSLIPWLGISYFVPGRNKAQMQIHTLAYTDRHANSSRFHPSHLPCNTTATPRFVFHMHNALCNLNGLLPRCPRPGDRRNLSFFSQVVSTGSTESPKWVATSRRSTRGCYRVVRYRSRDRHGLFLSSSGSWWICRNRSGSRSRSFIEQTQDSHIMQTKN